MSGSQSVLALAAGSGLALVAVLLPLKAADIEFTTPALPWAVVDRSYTPPPLAVRSSGACPLGGVGFSIVSGELPPGIEFSRLGYFSGVPTRTGAFEFAVRVSNGCTWTARRYTLVVTGAAVIMVAPGKLALNGDSEAVLRVSASWPQLPYRVTSSTEWLMGSPEHGVTPRETSALSGDTVHVRANTATLKPGQYSATLTVSAWQALEPVRVPVELTVAR
jgi:hypothetical protein